MTKQEYDFLFSNFIGAYFNQDWDLESRNPRDIIEDFKRTHSQEDTTLASTLLQKLLTEVTDDIELEDILDTKLYCCYNPAADGKTTRAWLQEVIQQLNEKMPIK